MVCQTTGFGPTGLRWIKEHTKLFASGTLGTIIGMRSHRPERGRSLSFSTSALVQVLSLFSYARRVTVNGRSRMIWIHKRWFWFFNSHREIPFDRVRHIDFGYHLLTVSAQYQVGWNKDDFGYRMISVVCDNPRETVPLARFPKKVALPSPQGS